MAPVKAAPLVPPPPPVVVLFPGPRCFDSRLCDLYSMASNTWLNGISRCSFVACFKIVRFIGTCVSVNLGLLMLKLSRKIRVQETNYNRQPFVALDSGIGAKRRKSYPYPFRVMRACLDCSTHYHSQGKGRSSPQAKCHTGLQPIQRLALSVFGGHEPRLC